MDQLQQQLQHLHDTHMQRAVYQGTYTAICILR